MILTILELTFIVVITGVTFIFDRLVRFIFGPKIYAEEDVHGKIAIVTGANSGVGKQTALGLAKRGATVVMACRNLVEGKKAQDEIISSASKDGSARVDLIQLDLADLSSVRKFAEIVMKKYPKIDILVNNAGFCDVKSNLPKTKQGFELHMGVNHLGHFLLTHLLLDNIKRAKESRIISVSSSISLLARMNTADLMLEKSSSKRFVSILPYANSKFANALFAKHLGDKLKGTGVTTYSCCPGMAVSNFYSNFPTWMKPALSLLLLTGVDSQTGAETVIYCAVAKEVAYSTGLFYRCCSPKIVNNKFIRRNERVGLELWDESEKLVGLKAR